MSYKIEALNSSLDKKDFCCGKALLNNYLPKQAGLDIKRKLCVVFDLTEGTTIKEYYSLSNDGIPRDLIPEIIQKKVSPSHQNLPATLLGRKAVDERYW